MQAPAPAFSLSSLHADGYVLVAVFSPAEATAQAEAYIARLQRDFQFRV